MSGYILVFTKLSLMNLTLLDLVNKKILWRFVVTNTNKHVKYESPVINSFQDINRKAFCLPTDMLWMSLETNTRFQYISHYSSIAYR